jgi:DNA-binding transcriptional regulator YiaG
MKRSHKIPFYKLRDALNKKKHFVFLQALAFLLLTAGMYSCNNNKPVQTSGVTTVDSLRSSVDSLTSQNNASHNQIDQLTSKSAVLDSQVKAKDAQITKLNGEITQLLRKNKKLAKNAKADQKLIASLRDELQSKDKEFADKLGVLQNSLNDATRQRDSLLAKYNYIKHIGSVLHASGIRLEALHLKRHGTKEKDTHRARKADVLRVTFDIDENRIAENGTKKLYLVIKDPEGRLLNNPSNGSGTTTASDGSQLQYSILKEIPLKQNEPVNNLSADWKQDDDYKKGTYTITIYNEGYKIGGGKVELD